MSSPVRNDPDVHEENSDEGQQHKLGSLMDQRNHSQLSQESEMRSSISSSSSLVADLPAEMLAPLRQSAETFEGLASAPEIHARIPRPRKPKAKPEPRDKIPSCETATIAKHRESTSGTDLSTRQNEDLTRELQDLQAQVNNLQKRVVVATQQNVQLSIKRSQLETTVEETERRYREKCDDFTAQLQRATAEQQELQQKIDELTAEKDTLVDLQAEQQKETRELQERNDAWLARSTKQVKENDRLRMEVQLHIQESGFNLLQSERYRKEVDELKSLLTLKDAKITDFQNHEDQLYQDAETRRNDAHSMDNEIQQLMRKFDLKYQTRPRSPDTYERLSSELRSDGSSNSPQSASGLSDDVSGEDGRNPESFESGIADIPLTSRPTTDLISPVQHLNQQVDDHARKSGKNAAGITLGLDYQGLGLLDSDISSTPPSSYQSSDTGSRDSSLAFRPQSRRQSLKRSSRPSKLNLNRVGPGSIARTQMIPDTELKLGMEYAPQQPDFEASSALQNNTETNKKSSIPRKPIGEPENHNLNSPVESEISSLTKQIKTAFADLRNGELPTRSNTNVSSPGSGFHPSAMVTPLFGRKKTPKEQPWNKTTLFYTGVWCFVVFNLLIYAEIESSKWYAANDRTYANVLAWRDETVGSELMDKIRWIIVQSLNLIDK